MTKEPPDLPRGMAVVYRKSAPSRVSLIANGACVVLVSEKGCIFGGGNPVLGLQAPRDSVGYPFTRV
jgi:hypothetical protein